MFLVSHSLNFLKMKKSDTGLVNCIEGHNYVYSIIIVVLWLSLSVYSLFHFILLSYIWFIDRNEKSQFINQLTLFIDRLLSIVDEDLNIGYNKQKDIMEQVEGTYTTNV